MALRQTESRLRGAASEGLTLSRHIQNDKRVLKEMPRKKADSEREADSTGIVRTVCDRCHCECGVLVHVRDERAIKVEGDPHHPINEGSLCPKGLAVLQTVYHADRILYPMKRTGQRGEGKWKRISWDEALDTVAAKF